MISPNTSALFKEKIDKIFISKNTHAHKNQDIHVLPVLNAEQGFLLAKELLYQLVDSKTVLFLSGGRTPKSLYEILAKEHYLHPGSVVLIDERYGKKWHENSNEKMMKDAGLLDYLTMQQIPFYPILLERHPEFSSVSQKMLKQVQHDNGSVQNDEQRKATAQAYDETLRHLFATFPKSIGILGIGVDGHTAGLPSNLKIWKETQMQDRSLLVTHFDDHGGFYNERITMTFTGLSMLDLLLLLVFGDDKKEALDEMFDPGSEKEIPARLYKRPEIAAKTVLITDQKV